MALTYALTPSMSIHLDATDGFGKRRELLIPLSAGSRSSGIIVRRIAAMDFFTVPTLTFGVLYCFFLIAYGRRRILHFHVTSHPTTDWVIQQLREAFAFESSHKYLIFDRDQKFRPEVIARR